MEYPLEIAWGHKDRAKPESPNWYQWVGMGVPAVLVDLITPLSLVTLPLIPFIVLIEAFVFWLLARKVKVPVGFCRLVLATLTANVVTSLLGTVVPLYRYTAQNLMWIGVAFVASVFVEWGIYILFFRKVNISTSDLLKVSFVGNLTTYALIATAILVWA